MAQISAPKTLHRDRRVWVSAVAGLASLALVGFGALAVAAATRPEPAIAETAVHARLSVVTEAVAAPVRPIINDKMATLGPAQLAQASQPVEPVDPALQSVLTQERDDQVRALADQRAFDARLKAELNDNATPADGEAANPAPSSPQL